ncbi:Zinc finger C-x8-C-x5-C-x3-H type family protein, partial [Prunus dulcis]
VNQEIHIGVSFWTVSSKFLNQITRPVSATSFRNRTEEINKKMPPKQQSKADLAKKQKIVEDKTFGLKNKNKSKNVQKYVQTLKQSVQPQSDPSKTAAKKKKEEDKAKDKELNELFKVAVSQPKVPVVYAMRVFKAGQCAKGFKCKFSHDLNVQRKGEKIDIYSDKRDHDTMEEWDQETLEKVVESKKNEYQQNKPTDIVCKYFLEAVEKKQYGWFWVCPNGGKNCHYRHALPPGYVLKSQMKALLEEEAEKIPIEEEIENQRAKVTTSTPMTTELFMQWKKKKMAERDAGLAAQMAERAKNDRMSGRELFLSDSSLFVDDVEAHEKYQRDQEPPVAEQKVSANSNRDRPSDSATAGGGAKVTNDDDDDELDIDELNELEASLSKVTIQEPDTAA